MENLTKGCPGLSTPFEAENNKQAIKIHTRGVEPLPLACSRMEGKHANRYTTCVTLKGQGTNFFYQLFKCARSATRVDRLIEISGACMIGNS